MMKRVDKNFVFLAQSYESFCFVFVNVLVPLSAILNHEASRYKFYVFGAILWNFVFCFVFVNVLVLVPLNTMLLLESHIIQSTVTYFEKSKFH